MVEYALLGCLNGVLLIGALVALTGGVNNAMGGATNQWIGPSLGEERVGSGNRLYVGCLNDHTSVSV